MLRSVFHFELRRWLRSGSFYFFALFSFLFALLSILGTGGYFDGREAQMAKGHLLNSPYELTSISFLFAKIFLLFIAFFVGQAIYRDFQSRTYLFSYAYPIEKRTYLLGKFLSSLCIVLMISILTYLGIWLGAQVLGNTHPQITAFDPTAYSIALGIYLMPTILNISLIVFAIVGISRNIYSGGLIVILLVVFQSMLENMGINSSWLLELLDPFSQFTFESATRLWDLRTRDAGALPLSKMVFFNRLFWLSLSIGIFILFYRRFDFQIAGLQSTPFQRQVTPKNIPPSSAQASIAPVVQMDFSIKGRWKVFLYLLRHELQALLNNIALPLLAGFGIISIGFLFYRITHTNSPPLWPLTRFFLQAPLKIYTLILLVITFLLMGQVMRKARLYRMDALVDATPVPTASLLFSKVGAIAVIQGLLMLLFLAVAVGVQLYHSYFNIEPILYVFHLCILTFPILLFWNTTSAFVFSLLPNLFVGMFLLLALVFGSDALGMLGIQTHLLKVNTLPELSYSDFHGYGQRLPGYFLIMAYWIIGSLIALLLTFLLWQRGYLTHFKERWNAFRKRCTYVHCSTLLFLLASFFFLGIYIFQEEQLVQQNRQLPKGARFEAFKQKWATYSKIPQPKINAIDLELDLFPKERRFQATALYTLKNKTSTPLDTVFIRTGYDERTRVDWGGQAQQIEQDTLMKYCLFQLVEPLSPGDSIEVKFHIQSRPNTLFSRQSNVLQNGSFLRQDFLPRLNFPFAESKDTLVEDLTRPWHYFHRDADRLHLQTTIRTVSDQWAIAPGTLVEQTQQGGRQVFRYRTPQPIKLNFSFHSARYQRSTFSHGNQSISVFHHPNHQQNIEAMVNGVRAALDYNSSIFGKYPYKEVRIIEFPHTEAGFSATLMANNIVASEMLFNIRTKAGEEGLPLPFYVMAHELTHEWFGNQLLPGEGAGAKMLTESLTEYLTLGIYRTVWGEKKARAFLRLQYQRYQNGRRRETEAEMPLADAKAQQEYIAYGKGTLALQAIASRIGKNQLDQILLLFHRQFGQSSTMYPTTRAFILFLKEHTPTAYHHWIDEWLTTTTHVELDLLEVKKISKDSVGVMIHAQQFHEQEQIPFTDQSFEISTYDAAKQLLSMDTIQLHQGPNEHRLPLLPGAQQIVVDPNGWVMDHNRQNNESIIDIRRVQ